MKENMSAPILCLTDFSELSECAYGMARYFAKLYGTHIKLLHVIETPGGAILGDQGQLIDDGDIDIKGWRVKVGDAEAAMTHALSTQMDIPQGVVKQGPLTQTILSEIEISKPVLVCLGTKGAIGMKEWMSSSEVAVLARMSPVPLISLKLDKHPFQLKNMLYLCRSDKKHIEDTEPLRELLKRSQANLHLIQLATATELNTYAKNHGYQNHDQALTKMEAALLEYARSQSLGTENLIPHVVVGDDAESSLIQFLQANDIDMLGIGVHRHFGLGAHLAGSLTKTLLNHFQKPILTFPIHE